MIYAGGGVVLGDASEKLTALVRKLGFPCTNTLMGLGGYPATDRQFVGMLGMHGNYEANMGMHYCDVLLAVGARFDDRVIGSPAHFASEPRRIIHIDIDPSSISKRVKVDVPIVGDVGEVLGEMLAMLDGAPERLDQDSLAVWWKQIDEWRRRDCLKFNQGEELIKPQYVVQKLWEVTGGDAFVTSDVGQHQMWAAQYYKFDKPRRWINSGGLGTDFPAFGLPNGLENDANGHCLQTLCGGIVVSDAACGGQHLAGTLRERHGNNLCAQLPDALSAELGKPSNREGQCLACRNTRRMRLVDQAGSAHFHLGRADGGLGFGRN